MALLVYFQAMLTIGRPTMVKTAKKAFTSTMKIKIPRDYQGYFLYLTNQPHPPSIDVSSSALLPITA
jgi:hypothetical protein